MREMFEQFFPHHRVDTVYLSAAWNLADAPDLAPTLAYLRRFVGRVIVIGRIPAHSDPLPTLLARSLLEHDDQLVTREQAPYSFQVDRLFKTLVPAADYVSLTDALCPAGRCQVWAAPGVPLQFDWDHLTKAGSRVVAQLVTQRATHLAQPIKRVLQGFK